MRRTGGEVPPDYHTKNKQIDLLGTYRYSAARKGVMNKYVCVSRLYPAKGVPGVLGVLVRDEGKIEEYLSALGAGEVDAMFTRVTSVPEKFSEHLAPEDIICKFKGLSEPYLDVLRPVKTCVYWSKSNLSVVEDGRWSPSISWDQLEDLRAEAAISGTWKVSITETTLAISDKAGNLAVINSSASRILIPDGMEIFTRKATVCRPRGVRLYASWRTVRWVHKCMFDAADDMESFDMGAFFVLVKRYHELSLRVPHPKIGVNEFYLVFSRAKRCGTFWERIRREAALGRMEIPEPFLRVTKKWFTRTRSIRLTEQEAEECMDFIRLDDWNKLYPPFTFKASKE